MQQPSPSSPSFLHRTKKKEDITAHQQCEIFKVKSFQEEAQIFTQSSALFIEEKEAQASTFQNFNPQEDKRYMLLTLEPRASHSIRSTNLERRTPSKSDNYLADAAADGTCI